jgi:hypothetical protein
MARCMLTPDTSYMKTRIRVEPNKPAMCHGIWLGREGKGNIPQQG